MFLRIFLIKNTILLKTVDKVKGIEYIFLLKTVDKVNYTRPFHKRSYPKTCYNRMLLIIIIYSVPLLVLVFMNNYFFNFLKLPFVSLQPLLSSILIIFYPNS